MLINGRLFRCPDTDHPDPRCIILADTAFDAIKREHLQLQHAGRDKAFASVEAKYCGVIKDGVAWVVARCKNCLLNRPSAVRPPFQTIEVNHTFERIQIDLIDM